jgi:hypothetical protein
MLCGDNSFNLAARSDEISIMMPQVGRGDVKLSGTTASNKRTRSVAVGAALMLLSLSLGGCSTSIADLPFGGTTSDAPERPKDVSAYPAVHDLPGPRDEAAMDPAEQAKV